ncbi:MAG: cytochrome P450 [Candidatus Eremiobacteraeota bacterium]|nr:cytochrome P450 [Candidatus Eremiobacteraeota bacterium]
MRLRTRVAILGSLLFWWGRRILAENDRRMLAVKRRVAPPSIPGFRLAARPFPTLPQYLLKLTRERGPVFRFRNLQRDIYFFSEPELVEEVFVTKSPSFTKARGTQRLVRLLGRGLLTSEQPQHLRHRRLAQPAFHRRRIDGYAEIMVERTLAHARRWQAGDELDLDREMNRIALEIVSQALFGTDLSRDLDTVATALDEALSTFAFGMLPFSELFDRLPIPPTRKLRAARERLDDVVYRMIAEHRSGGGDSGDLLSMLLASDDERGRLSDEQVRDEAMTILLAGHETTANALAWTFYMLQRNPQIEARLYAQVDEVLGDREATVDDLPRLDYVRAVFSETLRLYPPAWITARRARRTVDVGPYTLDRGDIAIVSQYVSHRDPRYFAQPEKYEPERWLGEAPPKFAYFPFGGGNRLCIGESFAWMEGVLAIATIVRRMRMCRVDDTDVATLPLVTLRPRSPIRARVELRPARVIA